MTTITVKVGEKIFNNMQIGVFLCPNRCSASGGVTTLNRIDKYDGVRCRKCGWWGWFKPESVRAG